MTQPDTPYSIRSRMLEWIWIAAILVIAGLAHGINMFGYPYREADEGIYMSQAWAVVRQGKLAPYTYWYDHAPVGWLQIAGWTRLTGGFYTFGTPINSGRMLMLVMRLASVLMLYRIARRISNNVAVASLAALLFALSAYDIYYGRQVLLDNIATFWMLLSLMLLICRSFTLKRACLSGVALGISILSKELIVVLIPAMGYLVWHRAGRQRQAMLTLGWLAAVFAVGSLYALMAVLHGELFPAGTWLGGSREHVSLLATLKWQASRGRDGGIFTFDSAFWKMVCLWASWERLLVPIGSAAAVGSVLLIRQHRLAAIAGLTTLSLWAFLARGGLILGFYLVPLIPLLALNLALAVGWMGATFYATLSRWLGTAMAALLGVSCLLGLGIGYFNRHLPFWTDPWVLWQNRQADALSEAVQWVAENLPDDSRIVIDTSMWVDLHEIPGRPTAFDDAHSYWKVLLDPETRNGVFGNDWRTIDYIVTTSQMLQDLRIVPDSAHVSEALTRSSRLVRFDTGGWPVEVRMVHKPKGDPRWRQ